MCKFKLFSIAAAALMMVACSTDDLTQQTQIKTGEMHFTATIAAPSGTTRTTYEQDGDNINVKWVVGDEIALIHNKVKDVATVKTINADGSATITGYVTGSPKDEDPIQLFYPAALVKSVTNDGNPVFDNDLWGKISTQDGTLKYIQDNLDFRSAKGQLSVNETSATLKEAATMNSQIAIWKLTLQNDAETPAALSAKKVSVQMTADVPILRASTAELTTPISSFYLAMEPFTGPITIEATVGDDTYKYEKKSVSIASGKYYQSTVTMTMQAPTLDTPLTFKALTAGTIVVSNPQSGMQYSLNGGEKTAVTSNAITVEAGQKVAFFGTAGQYSGTKFGGTAEVKVYGNIMSLLYADFADKKSLSDVQSETFKQLFENNIGLKDASGLLLPATTLINSCYYSMFKGCTGLTAAPKELPATSLDNNCYVFMFSGCSSLTTVPEELPATTLKSSCYYNMFSGCTSLTATPKLPATTVGSNCYASMFSGCTSLTKAYVKAAFSSLNCGNMFKGCTNASTSTFYSDNAAGWKIAFPNNLGDWQAEAYPLTYPVALSAVTSDYVGSVVTTDGNVYATAKDATDAGKTAVAKICYVGTTGDATYNHGLALALADEGKMDWSTAGTTCSGKNTSTPITGAKWLLASKDQWNNMITAAGGYTALRDGFTSVGGSNLDSEYYWSSTEYDTYSAWMFLFSDGSWNWFSKSINSSLVRACLAF